MAGGAMALREAIHFWGADWNGVALATAPTKRLTIVAATARRGSSPSFSSIASSSPSKSSSSSLERSIGRPLTKTGSSLLLPCRAKGKGGEEDDGEEDDGEEVERDEKGYDKSGYDKFGYDQFGYDRTGHNKYGVPRGAILDGKINDPEYMSYTDPLSGEPAPSYGPRTPLPNSAFWGDDLRTIQNSVLADPKSSSNYRGDAQTTQDSKSAPRKAPSPSSSKNKGLSDAESDGDMGPRGGRKRRSAANGRKKKSEAQSAELSEEELANIAELKRLSEQFREEERKGEFKSMEQVMQEGEVEDEKKKVLQGDEKKENDREVIEDEEQDRSLLKVMSNKGYALVRPDAATRNDEEKPLTNEELWWNWRKPPPDKKPWSAWQKRAGNSDTVMAAAMAETGQIKLFGDKPTLAESTLARARKKVFYDERIEAEEERKKTVGAMAYYQEWVKGWKQDTSKEAVQKVFEETGDEEGIQLLDMFAHQTLEEYRKMQGTDVRIKRDPLIMRMRSEQIKQVWGGDPVYPTINYIQDPEEWFDPRNENMHEPIPDILDILRKSGRLISQEELKAILDAEKAEEEEEFDEYDVLSEAVDIGEEEDEEENDNADELEEQPQVGTTTIAPSPPKKKATTGEDIFEI